MKAATEHRKLVRKVTVTMVVTFVVGMVLSVFAVLSNNAHSTNDLKLAVSRLHRTEMLVNSGTVFLVISLLALLFITIVVAVDRWRPPQSK